VFIEEQAILRAQQLELIYSQYEIIEKILPDVPRSKINLAKSKRGPHADVIVGSIDGSMANQLSQLQ